MIFRILADTDALTDSERRRLQQASARIPRYFRGIVSVDGTSREMDVFGW